MEFVRAAKALAQRLQQIVTAYFDINDAATSGAQTLFALQGYQAYIPDPDDVTNYIPETNPDGSPKYTEFLAAVRISSDLMAFLSSYNLAAAKSALGINQRFTLAQQNATVDKPAGAANMVTVPLDYSAPLPTGITWSSADPNYIYFDSGVQVVAQLHMWIPGGGTPGDDFATFNWEYQYEQGGAWQQSGGLDSNEGAVRVGDTIVLISTKRSIGGGQVGMRLSIQAGSYADLEYTIGQTTIDLIPQ